MRLSSGSRCGLICCAIAVVSCAVAGDNAGQTGSNVRYVTHDEKGRKTSEIYGDSATMLENDGIEITNLRLLVLNEGDASNVKVNASKCVWKLKDGVAESDSDVRIEGTNMVITGVGFRWSSGERQFFIRNRARVEITDVQGLDRNFNSISTAKDK